MNFYSCFPNAQWHYRKPILKTILVMKLIAFFIVITCLKVSATANAQGITLSVKQAPIEKVFNQIEKQTKYQFWYKNGALKNTIPISLNIKNADITKALEQVFIGQTSLSYEISGNSIIVKAKDKGIIQRVKDYLKSIIVKGKVTDEKGNPIAAVSVKLKGTNKTTFTDDNGAFMIEVSDKNAALVFSFVGFQRQEVAAKENVYLNIVLKEDVGQLRELSVVSTGYQELPKERATGSFTKIDNALFNRSVGPNIIDRLDGVTSGLIFNKNYFTGDANASSISIRGLSTIYANAKPLVVVDNFPIDGDLTNINPNDVQDITVLKDAAAASIWGARSGNGVIVITTKRGKRDQPLQVQFNTNYTLTSKPNAYYNPNFLNSSDFIGSEKFLFKNGFYDADLSNTANPPVISPVVELLSQQRNGTISAGQANAQIDALKNLDIRNDISKYLYRSTGTQQYALSLNGGSDKATYYFSAGYDKVPSQLVGNDYDRLNFNSYSTFLPIKNLQITAGLTYTLTNNKNNNPGYFNPGSSKGAYYPYAQLADASGNPLSLARDYRASYLHSLGNAQLLNWDYSPLAEIGLADNTINSNYAKFNTSIKYTFIKGLDALISYQLEQQSSDNENLQSQQTYYTRNLINLYTQSDGTHPLPLGAILDQNRNDFTSNSIRAQLNLNRTFGQDHQVAAIAGVEGKQAITNQSYNRQYGYNNLIGTTTPVDYVNYFTQYNNLSYPSTIPYENSIDKLTDEFFSYFANASYTYKGKYILSGSGRIDQSNLFGVNTNQKSVPLWSTGAAWEISKESFYKFDWVPYLKLRGSYGYNGNIDKSLSAFTTALFAGTSYLTNAPYVSIQNPPNPELRWERIGMLNLAVDFETKNRVVTGSLEYYHKNGIDILGYAPVDPTTGVSRFKGNVADMAGSGFDLDLTFRAGNKLQWFGNVLVSRATDKVTKYNATTSLAAYLQGSDGSIGISTITPVVGKPVFSVYSYKWAGLDPSNGDPQGYVNGQVSKDYAVMEGSANINDAVYNGPARPTLFGSFRNTFNYNGLSLSFNITYEFGYYFRRPSINYTNLAAQWIGNSDYELRWQKPGDETHTSVPSFTYPLSTARDDFYQYSSVLVDKGDNIRLKDISLSYDLIRVIKKILLKSLQVYGYANNLGILWKATKSGIDPDYVRSNYPNPRTFSMGIKTTF